MIKNSIGGEKIIKTRIFTSLLAIAFAAAMIGGATMAWFTAEAEGPEATFTAGTVNIAAGLSAGIEEHLGGTCQVVREKTYPARVVADSTIQGKTILGHDIPDVRSDAQSVLSDSDGKFLSLGWLFENGSISGNGQVVVEFANPIVKSVTIGVAETTWGSYPLEQAQVFASMNGQTWEPIGVATNQSGDLVNGSRLTKFSLGELQWARYVKVVDATDPDLFANRTDDTVDGFDVSVIMAMEGYLKCDNWNPGDCTTLCWDITNVGTKGIVFRVDPYASWKFADGTDESEIPSNRLANIKVELCDGETGDAWCLSQGYDPNDWLIDPNGENDLNGIIYYVGDTALASNESALLCLKVCLDGPGTEDVYQGATLTFGAEIEAVQASNGAPNDFWNVNHY